MFLPLKDRNPTVRTPYVTIGLIALNAIVFVYELTLGPRLQTFIASYGVVPYELTSFTDLVGVYRGSPLVHGAGPAFLPLTLVTSMFLHGGFMHIAGNMLYLWIFGNNIEDLLGPVKFLVFYVACGIGAGIAHVALHPGSTMPTVGASGAVAGVLGAYLIAYPRARVLSLVFIVIFVQLIEVPAALVLVFWFVIQFFSGFASISSGATGGVAWFAHIGGFLLGILLVQVLGAPQLRALREARAWQRQWNNPPR